MKLRFSSLDVNVMSHELSTSLVGLRLHNIYDLSSRIFLLKFQKPDHREQLIIDTGFRCHLTSFARTTASEPSIFVKRLRKLLGTRRVTSVSQIGTDRIIEFQFSDGLYRLYLEFYAAGNLVVTDENLNVLALFRSVSEGAEHEHLKIGSVYNLSLRQHADGTPEVTIDRLRDGLQVALAQDQEAEKAGIVVKKRKKNSDLKRAIGQTFREWPAVLLDHVLLSRKFDVASKIEDVLSSPALLEQLMVCMRDAQGLRKSITSDTQSKGYIIAKPRKDQSEVKPDQSTADIPKLLYDEYQPFRPLQFEDNPELVCLEFEGFNKTVDEFYSSIEGQRLDSKLQEREATAKKKLRETKKQHQQRLGTLQEAQSINVQKAAAIEANIERIQEATEAVNSLIAQGMDWQDIGKLIEDQQRRNNTVAQLIKLPLKLFENTVTLWLAEPSPDEEESTQDGSASETSSDSDSEEESSSKITKRQQSSTESKRLVVDIDLSLSPWANASQYYDQKKTAAEKQERTAQASSIALKSAEKKITIELKKGLSKEKDILRPLRRTFWFEKFYFFFSSEGYLVIGAKDPQQAELLYVRYFKRGDIFVHAEVKEALIVMIKNNPATPDAPIPPATLSQAGTLSISSSSAWDSKALLAAWWAKSDQVSKTSPHGDFLSPGNFHINGQKTYLPPAQLLVGIGIVFQISEESKANHTKHRITEGPPKNITEIDAEVTAMENDIEESLSEMKVENNDDSEDEDFPDAAPVTKFDSDDEDFPDANPIKVDDSDDEDATLPSNPLQSSEHVTAISLPKSQIPTIEEDTVDTESLAATEMSTTTKTSRRHLSAKERRLLKKGLTPKQPATKSPSSDTEDPTENPSQLDDDDETMSVATTTFGNRQSALPRGKRTKLKKAAAKYANQDEEDRKAAISRIGNAAGDAQRETELADRKAKELADQAAKQRRREQHLRAQAIGRAAEEARRAAATEGDDVDEESQKSDMAALECLVGNPLPGDDIMSAFPVCAPWSALGTYKYKVKMQPGSIKKGKAAREVLGKWQTDVKVAKYIDQRAQDRERVWPREAELIAGVKDTEVISVMSVGRVRVMMAGGNASGKANAKSSASKPKGKQRGQKKK